MKPVYMYNKTKVKAWIKKAHKHDLLSYGHGYITDEHVALVDESHMHPTILEVFGTLTPTCKYSADQFQKLINLPDKPIEVIDSHKNRREAYHRLCIFRSPQQSKGS